VTDHPDGDASVVEIAQWVKREFFIAVTDGLEQAVENSKDDS
jgi:hypothetical protein